MKSLKSMVPLAALGLAMALGAGCQTTSTQTKFSTPTAAAAAVQQAFQTQDLQKVEAIFGREGMAAVASGDPVADRHDREVIALALAQSWRWAPLGENAQELIIGDEQWPFPIPLIQAGEEWKFDSRAGEEEIRARRIGRNELGVIRLCHDYVRAQREYAGESRDGKPAGVYAQKFRSSPGRQDGLFWRVKATDRRSPFGQLVAAAMAEGYDPQQPDAAPFHGYHFRILTAQGPAAPGGRKSYVVDGQMTGGFALLAFPAKHGSSGIMTFMVGPDGVIYQRNLGRNTAIKAPRLVEFNPDKSWTPVQPR